MVGVGGAGHLGPAERRVLAEVADSWTSAALSTRPSDRAGAEASLRAIYALLGHAPPVTVWVASPMAAGRLALLFAMGDGASRRSLLKLPDYAPFVGSPALAVERPAEGPAFSIHPPQLREVFSDESRKEVRRILFSPVHLVSDGSILNELQRELASVASTAVGGDWGGWDAVWRSTWGPLTSGEAVFASALQCRGLLRESPSFAPYHDLAAACSHCRLFERIAVMSERPQAVLVDELSRPHSVTDAAVEYRDGFRVFAIHGVPVPRRLVSRPLTPEEAVRIRHPVVRRELTARAVG